MLGPNGVGKSTIFNLNWLISPKNGKIKINGEMVKTTLCSKEQKNLK